MMMKTCSRKPKGDKGKKPISQKPLKRGIKSTKQLLEPPVQTYVSKVPHVVRTNFYGWETEAIDKLDMEDKKAFEDMQNVVADPGHTRGHISLFQQSIRSYWLIKCLLAKAIMSTQAIAESKLETTMADINRNIQEINLRQLHQYARLGWMEKDIGMMEKDIKYVQQVEVQLPRSSAKDPAPVE